LGGPKNYQLLNAAFFSKNLMMSFFMWCQIKASLLLAKSSGLFDPVRWYLLLTASGALNVLSA
jgi:hypothetical protein